MRLLFIEDNPVDATVVLGILNRAKGDSFEVHRAENLARALALAREHAFEAVLLDLGLPDATGFESLERVRGELGAKVPIVVLTGLDHEKVGVEAMRRGAQDFVSKADLEPEMLVRTLRYALERHRMTKALADSEHRLKILFEYAPDAYYLHDLQGTFIDGNKAAEAICGYSRSELIGKNFLQLDLLGSEDLRKAAAALARNAAGLPNGPEEYTLCRKDGTRVALEIRTFPVQVDEKILVLGMARDISERKSLQEQLLHGQKMEAIGRLAGGVAHDFNNLLVVMRGNAELLLLESEDFSLETQESLKQITTAAERASNLTRQLLAFSRKQVMQARPLALNEVIGNLVKMLTRIIGEQIHLRCEHAPRLPLVQADPGMIEQVLLNLAVNARDAMPRGGQLHISTACVTITPDYPRSHPEARAGNCVCITVRDTGTGIAPEHLPRIFEPFFTTKEVGKGTGLGLATTYGIVKQHQGWIEVESQTGAGTTFKIFLPVCSSEEATSADPKPEARPRGGKESILLVEDDLPVRNTTRRVLENSGYQVLEAGSAREGISVWENQSSRIDLLLSDIVMPEGMDGGELAETLRQRRPALKVILMSGYSPDTGVSDPGFMRKNRFRFLPKPCPSRTLLQTVRECLDAQE